MEKNYELNWELIKTLPFVLREGILEEFISDYEFIHDIELTREEAIQKLNIFPMFGKYTTNASSKEWVLLSWGSCFWNVYDITEFKKIMPVD
ncbi:hypothetical protein [Viridibacillus arvi]|uniref:hypothetical protein n=1 Tax=Viridibacillus arvi TaxID=263475 RepID=UPI0034CE173D